MVFPVSLSPSGITLIIGLAARFALSSSVKSMVDISTVEFITSVVSFVERLDLAISSGRPNQSQKHYI